MEKADLLILADYVITATDESPVIQNGAVAVKGPLILDAGPAADITRRYQAARTISPGGKRALMPGFVNAHTHAAMVYLRGIAGDLPLKDWLEDHIWPIESRWLSPEFVRDATGLACLEMLKAGVTTYSDMYFYEAESAGSAKKLGMRAVLGAGIVDFPTKTGSGPDEYLAKAENFIKKISSFGGGLVTPAVAPHSLYTCSPDTLKKTRKLADKYGVSMHLHLSETQWEVKEVMKTCGQRPVKFLHSIGCLTENTTAAHCVWVDDEEIELLAQSKAGVAHCPESNLKLASGFAPVAKMLQAGVRVSLGTDGAASNNDLNVMGEMGTAAKLHKALSGDPSAVDAHTAIKMATAGGAAAIGLGGKTGSIKKGLAADMIILDMNKPHLAPLHDVLAHIVYAALPSDVESVFVNGKQVVEKGRLITASEEEIMQKAEEWGRRIREERE
ncbi:MAG: amidohydrolase family protein [Nitrospiraceae bacterium]|nr:amidohydrolase family protein [Nitrospiraceae bacterium]